MDRLTLTGKFLFGTLGLTVVALLAWGAYQGVNSLLVTAFGDGSLDSFVSNFPSAPSSLTAVEDSSTCVIDLAALGAATVATD